MTRKSIIIAAAIAATLGAGVFALNNPSFAQPYGGGWGMMGDGPGPGMMGGDGPGYGRGPGMMGGGGPGWMHQGRGFGPGWMRGGSGPCADNQANAQGDLKLSVDDVKARVGRWLAWRNNPRLKVGEVKEKDSDTITADIVTADNSLVERFDVNRHTGFTRRQ